MKRAAFILSALLGVFGQAVHADRLLSTDGKINPISLVAPTRGATMDQVRQYFGLPAQIFPAVGQPPITRWVYPQFVVYFERHWVIHSVEAATSAQRQNPSAK